MSVSGTSTQARARLSLVEVVGTIWSSIWRPQQLRRDPPRPPSDSLCLEAVSMAAKFLWVQLGRARIIVGLLTAARPGKLESRLMDHLRSAQGCWRGVQGVGITV